MGFLLKGLLYRCKIWHGRAFALFEMSSPKPKRTHTIGCYVHSGHSVSPAPILHLNELREKSTSTSTSACARSCTWERRTRDSSGESNPSI
jgi:hypothetical protein